ncbi:four helix bundle protein [Ulvibacter antarcticus]|uniref:Four helix bundle protein n=1 Tax=Ulvibacter antarcticus TaxID=442714 RepID=A0A3L9Z3H9_9FLAO|nr:four helix bundle protein [Ulvibacter antarcticus]RMA64888.1 four helix bundle protein [Ulvibacter antarcticus]
MDYRELIAYRKSVDLAMQIFEITKKYPKEETYALTDQVRRSSRSVSANMAEAYRKRSYIKQFRSKLSDSDAENAETQTWLEFSFKCGYIDKIVYNRLIESSIEIGKLINFMILNPKKFGVN